MGSLMDVVGCLLEKVSHFGKEKGGFFMSKVEKILVLMVVVLFVGAGLVYAAEADTADVDILVTPGISVTLSASPTYYNFGTVTVNQSSVSVNVANQIKLTNGGTVGVTLEKKMTNDGSWTLVQDAPDAKDEFRLWCVGNTDTQPAANVFETAYSTFAAVNTNNNLVDTAGSQISLDAGKGTTTWFRIDMPPTVSNNDPQKFDITFTATEQ